MEQAARYSSKVSSKLSKNLFHAPSKRQSTLENTWYLAKQGIQQTVSTVDRRFFISSAVIVALIQLPSFLLSLFNITSKLADPSYVISFLCVTLATLAIQGTYYLRQIVVSTMVVLWGIRLGLFVTHRGFHMRDWRMEEINKSNLGILGYHLFQSLLAWTACLPVVILNTSSYNPMLGLRDMIGYAIWGSGFLIESIADWQKFQFHQRYKDRFCNVGLWRYSRHPNYFGEVLQWWGVFLCVSPVLFGPNWLPAVLGPLFLTFSLLFVSGIPPLERRNDQRFGKDPAYQRYKANVPILIPALLSEAVKETQEKIEKIKKSE
jgi:steroid 5-alpha reductase family enzyme